MDKDKMEDALDVIKDEILQVKAMMMELLNWKSEIDEALKQVQSGGIMAIMGKMLQK